MIVRHLGIADQAHFPIDLLVLNGSGYVAGQRGMVSALVPGEQPTGDAGNRARGARAAC